MTIIVGLKCSDAIVLASDSQTTDETGRKRTDADKIRIIQFANGHALAAASGSSQLANRMMQVFQSKASETKITSDETVSLVAVEAIRQLRNEILATHPQDAYTLEDWKRFFIEQMPLEAVIACYFERKPYLHRITVDSCIAEKVGPHFVTSGCGGDLGEFLMLENSRPNTDCMLGTMIAVHTVEIVIRHNAFCSAPTVVGWIRPPQEFAFGSLAEPCILPAERVKEVARLILQADEQTKESRTGHFRTALQTIADQAAQRFAEFHFPRPKDDPA